MDQLEFVYKEGMLPQDRPRAICCCCCCCFCFNFRLHARDVPHQSAGTILAEYMLDDPSTRNIATAR